MTIGNTFLQSVVARFRSYKMLGDKTLSQLSEAQCFCRPTENANSIAMIVRHMQGNMLSRWTHFLSEDGEKPWRNRDTEFEDFHCSKDQLIQKWDDGWTCLFAAINDLAESDLVRTIYIRTEPLTVCDAIVRQLMHYAYHVGQIVFYAKILMDDTWQSLSIAVGQSGQFNKKMGMK